MQVDIVSAQALSDTDTTLAGKPAFRAPPWLRTAATVLATLVVILVASALSVAIGLS